MKKTISILTSLFAFLAICLFIMSSLFIMQSDLNESLQCENADLEYSIQVMALNADTLALEAYKFAYLCSFIDVVDSLPIYNYDVESMLDRRLEEYRLSLSEE